MVIIGPEMNLKTFRWCWLQGSLVLIVFCTLLVFASLHLFLPGVCKKMMCKAEDVHDRTYVMSPLMFIGLM